MKKKLTMKEVVPYLKSKGIPFSMIQMIRIAFACDAVEEAGNLHWDRIYTAIALGLYHSHGYEAEEILSILQAINDEMVRLEDKGLEWPDLMRELKDETGIVVRTGDGQRVIVEITAEEEGNE